MSVEMKVCIDSATSKDYPPQIDDEAVNDFIRWTVWLSIGVNVVLFTVP